MADFSSTRSPELAVPKKKVCPESRTLSVISGRPGLSVFAPSGAPLGFPKPSQLKNPIVISPFDNLKKVHLIISLYLHIIKVGNPYFPTLETWRC